MKIEQKEQSDLEKLLSKHNLTEKELETVLKQMDKPRPQTHNVHNHFFDEKHIKYGLISDLHMGHKKHRHDVLKDAAKVFNKKSVDAIYCPGDIIEGMSNRDGHFYELAVAGVSNQLDYATEQLDIFKKPFYFILGNHDCILEGTDVLTDHGWIKIEDIRDEKIASLNTETDNIEFNKPINKIEGHEDDLILIESESTCQVVTPNHDVLFKNKKTKAKDLPSRFYSHDIKKVGDRANTEINLSKEWISLLVWVVCDATLVDYSKYNPKSTKRVVQFKLSKQTKISALRNLLESMGIKYTFRKATKSGINKLQPYYINIYGEYARELFRLLNNRKEIPVEFKDMGKEQLIQFIKTISLTDGWKQNNRVLWSNTNKADLDIIQECCVKNGIVSKIDEKTFNGFNKKTIYQMTFYNKKYRDNNVIRKKEVGRGVVYCFTMPLGTLVTRYNGKVAITGNCWSMKKGNQGVHIGKELERRLDNAHYLGDMTADINLSPNIKMRLSHDGSSAYALCFDDKTEILTDDGWKLFKDLNKSESVATLNIKKNKFEWQKPTKYTDEEYSGIMLHFKARSFDLTVTPNHRMLVRRYNTAIDSARLINLIMPQKSHKRLSKDWVVREAKELGCARRQEWQMKRGGQGWEGRLIEKIKIPFRKPKKFASMPIKHIGELDIEDAAELIAWYVTEGYIRNGSMVISQSQVANPDNHAQILDLLTRIGFKPKARGREKKDIVVNSVELCEWLVNECGSGSRNLFLPKWLKDQPSEILELVLETMIKGDGWVNGKGFGYKSISKKLREDFGEIAIKLGYAVTEWKDSVSISSIQIYPTINKKPDEEFYDGRIYCVSVPNSFILVRKNGRAIWSGNSYSLQKRINALEGGSKPNILHNGHIHKALYMFYRNIHATESGCLEDQTEFMAMKGTPAHVGFWEIDVWYNKEGVTRFQPIFYPYY